MRIRFRSDLGPSEVASLLAPCVYGSAAPPAGVPFESREGGWWELSESNDHKLDVLGTGDYAVRCRRADPELEALFRETIATFGGTFA